nr:PREDICTED: inward rectifier potassium channel 2-like [Bemisia tabaci]
MSTDDHRLLIVPDEEATTRKHKNRPCPRILLSSGVSNVDWMAGGKRVSGGWAPDIFTCLVEMRWWWLHGVFFLAFVVSWFVFALFWWAIAYAHGDLLDLHDPQSDVEPCVTELNDFISAFMFSLETQYTTGYGTRSPTTECPEAIFLLSFQSIFGLLLQAVLTGVIFAKLTRPKCRTQTIVFSRNATVSLQDDGYLRLMFRVGDPCSSVSHVGIARATAWIARFETNSKRKSFMTDRKELKLNGACFLFYPTLIEHRIDEDSPLFDMSALDFLHSQFEILISLEGVVETTGQNTEVRKSYLSSEILWGHQFREVVKRSSSGFVVNMDKFHYTYVIDTPLCSARQLKELVKIQ